MELVRIYLWECNILLIYHKKIKENKSCGDESAFATIRWLFFYDHVFADALLFSVTLCIVLRLPLRQNQLLQ